MSLTKDITNYIDGNINFYTRKKSTPQHIREQILYRMIQCAPCTVNKKCTECGCPTPKMFFAPNKQDKKNRWKPFFENEKEWEATKASFTPSWNEMISKQPNIYRDYLNLWT